jgi:hypothetical protein
VPSPNLRNTAIAAGYDHALALRIDGSLIGWGSDYERQTNIALPNVGYIAFDSGDFQSLAIRRVLDCNANGSPDECEIANGDIADDNLNGIPDICEARGDFNGDGDVNQFDYPKLSVCLAGPDLSIPTGCAPENLNGDKAVDLFDLAVFSNNFGSLK